MIRSTDEVRRTRSFYAIDDAARLLGVDRTEVERLVEEGRLWELEGLDAVTPLIPQQALEPFLQEH